VNLGLPFEKIRDWHQKSLLTPHLQLSDATEHAISDLIRDPRFLSLPLKAASFPRVSEPHFPKKSASPPAEGSIATWDVLPSLASADAFRRLASYSALSDSGFTYSSQQSKHD
jgi:hypothetical protein